MKEQDAAHSFEENDDFKIRNYGAIQNKLLSANAELTRLRSELQDTKDYYEKAQKHLIDEHFSELQQKDEETTALKMKSEAQLQSYLYTTDTLTKKLQQERELRKELLPLAERMIVILGEHANEHYKELIKKAKLNN